MAVDLPWGDPRTATFATSVGLITSDGPHGPNMMACEWTHQLSYSPGLIAVCIGPSKATAHNIEATKEFGVNIAATDQNVLSSIAGKNSGKNVDKIKALEELGFKFFKAKRIRAPMVEGAAMMAECRLVDTKTYGDHVMFVGEIVELYPATGKQPLVYHNTKYSAPGQSIPKPDEKELAHIAHVLTKHPKK
jgi:flavin reductase (DIM6/NTAB) family NADH-FMN oxidoreductase RutF